MNTANDNGQTKICELFLLKLGAAPKKTKHNISSFQKSVTAGHLQTAELMLRYKANIEVRRNGGYTPLVWCSEKGNFEAVRFLLQQKANVEAKRDDGHTAINRAARDGYTDVVGLLLQAKASVNVKPKSDNGYTAMVLAARNGHEDALRLLLEAGADPNFVGSNGKALLEYRLNNNIRNMIEQFAS